MQLYPFPSPQPSCIQPGKYKVVIGSIIHWYGSVGTDTYRVRAAMVALRSLGNSSKTSGKRGTSSTLYTVESHPSPVRDGPTKSKHGKRRADAINPFMIGKSLFTPLYYEVSERMDYQEEGKVSSASVTWHREDTKSAIKSRRLGASRCGRQEGN
jgi:hypothetical protein